MLLLKAFLEIVKEWEGVFPQTRTTKRAIRQALGSLICVGRRMLTRIICAIGNEDKSWSGEYFLHSRSAWSPEDLFKPIVRRALSYCRGPLLGVVVDDTSVKKTGRRILQAFWARDPMSPPFWVNLRLGIRFLQFAVVLPLHHTLQAAARTIPILFEEVGVAKKPRKGCKDYEKKMKEYKELSKNRSLTIRAVEAIGRLRTAFDVAGAVHKILVIIGDGAFCNRSMFGMETKQTHLLVRARKDVKLCKRSKSAMRFYDEKTFTPVGRLK